MTMGIAVDPSSEPAFRWVTGPEEEHAAVVETDSLDRCDVRRPPSGEVHEIRVEKPAVFRESELLMLLFPLRILLALVAAPRDSNLAVRRPTSELCPGIRIIA